MGLYRQGFKRGFKPKSGSKSQFGSIGQKTNIAVWAESLGQKILTEDLYNGRSFLWEKFGGKNLVGTILWENFCGKISVEKICEKKSVEKNLWEKFCGKIPVEKFLWKKICGKNFCGISKSVENNFC